MSDIVELDKVERDKVESANQECDIFLFRDDFPKDVLELLFFKLPVKTLLECKKVCGPWECVIECSDFAHRHADNMQSRQHLQPFTKMFTFYWHGRKNVIKLVSINDDLTVVEKSPKLRAGLSKQQIRKALSNNPIWTVMHCKGVLAVCFFGSYELLMYNPVTRECELIQPSSLQNGTLVKSVAFGFCHHRPESFKYVILTSVRSDTSTSLAGDTSTSLAGDTRTGYFFEVYSRGEQKSQSIKADVGVTDACACWNDGVLCDEIFYWIVPGKQTQQKLLCFNMSNNSISHLILPDGLQRPEGFFPKKLVQWNNSLAIIFYACGLKTIYSFEVWALYDSTWTRHATIELDRSFFIRVFWKPTELLLQEEGGKLWSYNLCKKDEDEDEALRAIPTKSKTELFHATCFFESLVTV